MLVDKMSCDVRSHFVLSHLDIWEAFSLDMYLCFSASWAWEERILLAPLSLVSSEASRMCRVQKSPLHPMLDGKLDFSGSLEEMVAAMASSFGPSPPRSCKPRGLPAPMPFVLNGEVGLFELSVSVKIVRDIASCAKRSESRNGLL